MARPSRASLEDAVALGHRKAAVAGVLGRRETKRLMALGGLLVLRRLRRRVASDRLVALHACFLGALAHSESEPSWNRKS